MNEAVRGYQHRWPAGAPVQRARAGVDAVAGRGACVFRAAVGLPILVPLTSRPRRIVTMSRYPDPARTLLISAGEHRLLRAAAGSRWLASRGDVRLIEPPRWLGERMVGIELVLHDGAEHVFERGGWVDLHAARDSALVCATPQSLVSRLLAAWRMIRPGRGTRVPA